jgi:hypothetical protein
MIDISIKDYKPASTFLASGESMKMTNKKNRQKIGKIDKNLSTRDRHLSSPTKANPYPPSRTRSLDTPCYP